MELNEYQTKSRGTAIYPKIYLDVNNGELREINFVYPLLGLGGEAGETFEKFKKIIRDKQGIISNEDKVAIGRELGDQLWYIANVATDIGMSLEEIAQGNLDKLQSRQTRGKLSGSGDNR